MERLLFLVSFAAASAAPPVLAQHSLVDPQPTLARVSDGLAFVENRGQWPEEVRFCTRLGGGTAWITRDGVTFDFYAVERAERDPDAHPYEKLEAVRRRGHVVRMRFEGGQARGAMGRGQRAAYHNYFLGSDPSRWASRVPLYDDGGHLRYDLLVSPGADASQIRMRMEGATDVSITADGALSIGTPLGAVKHRGLLAYQEGARGRETVASAFRVEADGAVVFEVQRADSSRALVIDPLIWATFLGGSREDSAAHVSVDGDGSALVAGYSFGGFPTTPGAYDAGHDADSVAPEAFVARLSADGSALVFGTYIGGTSNDFATGIAVGVDGHITVAGRTVSANFPTTPGAFDTSFNGTGVFPSPDAFVARLSADGSALLYSTFLGGTDDDAAYDIVVGADRSATVLGSTDGEGFPATANAYDPSYNGNGDVYVAQLTPDGAALQYSTFLGGSNADNGYSLSVGADGSVAIIGQTSSADFPATVGAFDTSFNGGYDDAFAARLSADGTTLVFATFIGGDDQDFAGAVSAGTDGSWTVVGSTESRNFPTTAGSFDPSFNGGRSDAYALRFSADGSALHWSTFLGGSFNDYAIDGVTDPSGHVTLVGYTEGSYFPTTPGAFDTSHNGDRDAFVTRLATDGRVLLYSTYLGGRESDGALGIGVGADGTATVVGYTQSFDFPATQGAFDTSHNGDRDTFVARIDVGIPVAAEPSATGPHTAAVWPNPVSSHAALSFALARSSDVRLALYDVLGREVAAVEAGWVAVGAHRLGLDVSALPVGIYVWRLTAGERVETGQLTVAR